ncbi:MAG: hypothetical protein MZV70_04625 [Desulfobacterales bacterium]|nr:hypothetical protein [Desulfobacterales bacterium]
MKKEEHLMNLFDMNFPRQLEVDGSAEKIREALTVRKTRLWPEGKMEVPVLNISETLTGAIKKARLQRRVRFGFDDIFDKLAAEKKASMNCCKRRNRSKKIESPVCFCFPMTVRSASIATSSRPSSNTISVSWAAN